MSCLKLIINELGRCPTRSDNVYFAINEPASLAFTAAFCFANVEHIIYLNLDYIIIDQCHLLKIFRRVLSEIQANQTNSSSLKISQSTTLNKAHVIEITKACTVTFMKTRNSLVVRCRKKHVNWEKKQKMVKIYFLKRWLIDFGYHRKVIHGSTKLFTADLVSNGLQEKVNDIVLKLGQMQSM